MCVNVEVCMSFKTKGLTLAGFTGNSAVQAIELLIKKGVPESHIIFLNLISVSANMASKILFCFSGILNSWGHFIPWPRALTSKHIHRLYDKKNEILSGVFTAVGQRHRQPGCLNQNLGDHETSSIL